MSFGNYDQRPSFNTSRLPPKASVDDREGFNPSNSWLKNTATPEEALVAMRAWFRARFWDPANDTPYDGGYVWIYGGPHSPSEELNDRFNGVVEQGLIDTVADEMLEEVGDEWAPIQHDGFYDEQFEIDVPSQSTPLTRLVIRLDSALGVLELNGPQREITLARQLVFSALIGAFETYLWETTTYWTENDENVFQNLISKLQALKDRSLTLASIFERHANLKAELRTYLQNIVWHRWDQVAQIFTHGMQIQTPSFRAINDALVKRHDIVHRSGQDQQGNPIVISEDETIELAFQIHLFAWELDAILEIRNNLNVESKIISAASG